MNVTVDPQIPYGRQRRVRLNIWIRIDHWQVQGFGTLTCPSPELDLGLDVGLKPDDSRQLIPS